MIDLKRIEEAERNVEQYISGEWLILKRKDMVNNADFFMKNATTSLLTAQALFDLSNDESKKKAIGQMRDFESYLWVVVSSYYSMFYASLALMAKNEMKADGQIHQVVEDTLIARFLNNQKLAKLVEQYQETRDKAQQIMGSQERARVLVENYGRERGKRNELQYELGKEAKRNLADTSLRRASEFMAVIRTIF